jgi:hypothetical protein
MKKLEDIPKKQVFEAPEGYFDTLPGIIQARVAKKEGIWSLGWRPALRYALPILVMGVGLIWYLNSGKNETPEQLLASIEAIDIEDYLDESDMTTEELLDNIDYNQIEVDSLEFENSVLDFDDADVDELLNNLETEL